MGVLARSNVHVSGVDGAPAIVFLHGFGCDQAMWRHVAPAFATTHRVVLLDLVGFGGSDLAAFDPERHGTLHGHAADLVEVLAELDAGPVVFVGHSVSAMIGVLASITAPEAFERLVLVCPSPRYIDDDGYVGGFSEADIDELLTSLDDNYLGWSTTMAPLIVGRPDRPELGEELTTAFCRADPTVASTFARATFLSDCRAELAEVARPTLVLQTRVDAIASPEVGAYVRDHISGAAMTLLDTVGHCPNLSAPEETIAAIRPFLPPP